MNSLFEEVDQYEKTINDRKNCYFIVMLAMEDDLHWYREFVPIINPVTGKQDGHREEFDFEALELFDEKRFIDYQYEKLIEFFPNASKVFKRELFMDSNFLEEL